MSLELKHTYSRSIFRRAHCKSSEASKARHRVAGSAQVRKRLCKLGGEKTRVTASLHTLQNIAPMVFVLLSSLCIISLVVVILLARAPSLERHIRSGLPAGGVVGWVGRGVPVESRGTRLFRLPLTVGIQTERGTQSVDVVVLVDQVGLSALVRNARFDAIVDRRDLRRMVITRVSVDSDRAVTIEAPALQLT